MILDGGLTLRCSNLPNAITGRYGLFHKHVGLQPPPEASPLTFCASAVGSFIVRSRDCQMSCLLVKTAIQAMVVYLDEDPGGIVEHLPHEISKAYHYFTRQND